jgi:dTDP-4-amino-4,6-dideoxygalactose transaminase
MKMPMLDLVGQYHSIKEEMDAAVLGVLESGRYILGLNVAALEEEIAAYLGVRHAVGVASGTDALIIVLRAAGVGPGDEVIVPAYSFFATAEAVLSVGAEPVFVDIDPQTYCMDTSRIEGKITPKTRALVPVHLYGHAAQMNRILAIAAAHGLRVIEDNAQAFGATFDGRKTGSLGDAGCLSFFPSKNLGGYGDGGMVVTDDGELAQMARRLRTHGWQRKYYPETVGYNSRLDELQAAMLRVKLKYVDGWNERRRKLAHEYTQRLGELGITTPVEMPGCRHVYHLYVARFERRAQVQTALKEAGIASEVYYPQPLHHSVPCRHLLARTGSLPQAEEASEQTLALPLYPAMTVNMVRHVVQVIEHNLPVNLHPK